MNKIEGIKSAIEGLRTCGEADKRLIWIERLIREVPNLIAEHEQLEKENEATNMLRKYVAQLIEVKDRKIMLELLNEMKTIYSVAMGDFIPIQHYESIKEKESTFTKLQRVCDCAREATTIFFTYLPSFESHRNPTHLRMLPYITDLQQAIKET